MSSVATAIALFAGFHVFGLGLALRVRAATGLPPRFLGLLITASTALLSYGVFWIAVMTPSIRFLIVAVIASSVLATAAVLRAAPARAALRTTGAWLPPLLAGVLAAVYLWPVLAAGPAINDRLTWTLPPDNILPGLFAHRVLGAVASERTAPLLGPGSDHASERPPLQAAVVVTIGSMVRGSAHEYTILAALCQAQWLPAIWLVGAAGGLSRRMLAVVLVACAVSGFFFVNTIYAWPKLFAAALMLGALAIALEPPAAAPRAATARALAVAALCALSLLAHPGPLFTLLAALLLWPVLRPVIGLRPTLAAAVGAAAVAIALLVPWLAYQAFVDPPSGRLVREHLGDGRTDGSVVQAIVRANVERPVGEQIRVRAGNLATQVGNPLVALWPRSIALGQREQFFHHGAALGVLIVGLALSLARPRPGTPDDVVRRLAIVAVVALASWSLLVFAPGQAVIHHGSPVTTALLFFAGAYGLTRLPAAVAWTMLAAHAGAGVYIWFVPIWRGPWGAG